MVERFAVRPPGGDVVDAPQNKDRIAFYSVGPGYVGVERVAHHQDIRKLRIPRRFSPDQSQSSVINGRKRLAVITHLAAQIFQTPCQGAGAGHSRIAPYHFQIRVKADHRNFQASGFVEQRVVIGNGGAVFGSAVEDEIRLLYFVDRLQPQAFRGFIVPAATYVEAFFARTAFFPKRLLCPPPRRISPRRNPFPPSPTSAAGLL